MNKKFVKGAIASVIALSLSGHSFAQESSDGGVLMPPQKKVVIENLNTEDNLGKASQPENAIDRTESDAQRQSEISQVSRLDALTTKASEGGLEIQILQQELERKKIETQLKEDDFKKRLDSAMTALASQFQDKEAEYQKTIESLQNELRRQRHLNSKVQENATNLINESGKTENTVFVTNVVGVGSNLTASVYFEDKIIDVREGMRISPELLVLEILANGVVFQDGSDESFVALTNEEYAFSKTFNKEAATLMKATMSGQSKRSY